MYAYRIESKQRLDGQSLNDILTECVENTGNWVGKWEEHLLLLSLGLGLAVSLQFSL